MCKGFIYQEIFPGAHESNANRAFNSRIDATHHNCAQSAAGETTTSNTICIHVLSGAKYIECLLILCKKNSRPGSAGTEQRFGHYVFVLTGPFVLRFNIVGIL